MWKRKILNLFVAVSEKEETPGKTNQEEIVESKKPKLLVQEERDHQEDIELLTYFPEEILFTILVLVEFQSVTMARIVCKQFKRIIQCKTYWKRKLSLDLPYLKNTLEDKRLVKCLDDFKTAHFYYKSMTKRLDLNLKLVNCLKPFDGLIPIQYAQVVQPGPNLYGSDITFRVCTWPGWDKDKKTFTKVQVLNIVGIKQFKEYILEKINNYLEKDIELEPNLWKTSPGKFMTKTPEKFRDLVHHLYCSIDLDNLLESSFTLTWSWNYYLCTWTLKPLDLVSQPANFLCSSRELPVYTWSVTDTNQQRFNFILPYKNFTVLDMSFRSILTKEQRLFFKIAVLGVFNYSCVQFETEDLIASYLRYGIPESLKATQQLKVTLKLYVDKLAECALINETPIMEVKRIVPYIQVSEETRVGWIRNKQKINEYIKVYLDWVKRKARYGNEKHSQELRAIRPHYVKKILDLDASRLFL